MIGLTLVGSVALIFGWLTARRITAPIQTMAEFTRRMKQAPSLAEKIKIVGDLSDHKTYTSVNKQYKQMQEAKKLLMRRHQLSQTRKNADKNSDLSQVSAQRQESERVLAEPLLASETTEIKPGQELKHINAWTEAHDEIDELKKIFFGFMKRWVENDCIQKEVNALNLHERHPDEEPFKLMTQNDKVLARELY